MEFTWKKNNKKQRFYLSSGIVLKLKPVHRTEFYEAESLYTRNVY